MIVKTSQVTPLINQIPQNTNIDSNKETKDVNDVNNQRENKVQNIKDTIANGTYKFDLDKTSEKMARYLLNQ